MCGIFFSITSGDSLEPDEETLGFLRARGPDCLQKHRVNIKIVSPRTESLSSSERHYSMTFVATVLALRGKSIQPQPMLDAETGSVLCWNGEAWKVDNVPVSGNDTSQIFHLLLTAAASTPRNASQAIVSILTNISGPFSFVFYDALSLCFYYGRDRFGRRSLLKSDSYDGEFMISSVSMSNPKIESEVSADGIYHIDLLKHDKIDPERIPWPGHSPSINREIFRSPDPSLMSSAILDLETKLLRALDLRVRDIASFMQTRKGVSRVAILFSGGLDCTVLARLTHSLLPSDEPIDLINVAFENPRIVAANPTTTVNPYESCPDRITGRSSFEELRRTCPDRQWRFVTVDVPFAEALKHRATITRLMKPHNTEMDLSIAMALYFAARGQGYAEMSVQSPEISSSGQKREYIVAARVLLSGLGADELLGGYMRHSRAFSQNGYPGLIDELELDFQRIGQRNLGRDDRVLSQWGKEVRYPYLDEDFVEHVLELNVQQKCDFGQDGQTAEHGELDPAKRLLRMVALSLGLEKASREKKRAIQFGARTAKMDIGGGRRRGKDLLE